MAFRAIVIAALAVLTLAPESFALGGGGRGSGGGVSGEFSYNGQQLTYEGSCSNGSCSGTWSTRASVSEPLSALAVGLGLLGAGWLRRRR